MCSLLIPRSSISLIFIVLLSVLLVIILPRKRLLAHVRGLGCYVTEAIFSWKRLIEFQYFTLNSDKVVLCIYWFWNFNFPEATSLLYGVISTIHTVLTINTYVPFIRWKSLIFFNKLHSLFFTNFPGATWGPSRACVQASPALYHMINMDTRTWDCGLFPCGILEFRVIKKLVKSQYLHRIN